MIIHGYICISAMDECFLPFKFSCGGKKEKLYKAGSDRIKGKVYDDGKHVELQQILNTNQDLSVWVHRNCVNILFKKKSLAKVDLASYVSFHDSYYLHY